MNKEDEDGQMNCAAEICFGSFITKAISFPTAFFS
jgi:hypothetical protein